MPLMILQIFLIINQKCIIYIMLCPDILIYVYIYLKFWFPADLTYVVREPAYLTGAMMLDVLWSLPAPTGWKAFTKMPGAH